MDDIKYIKKNIIKTFFEELLITINCPSNVYKPVVNCLIETSLRGVDSHGIALMPHYIEAVLIGRINPRPKFIIKKTATSTALLDADHTFGITASVLAMNKAIALAKNSGIGCVVVHNSTHFGAAANYSLIAAKKNMIGLSFTNTDSLVLPFGGRDSFLGTNPICFAAPCEGENPFCLDMATSIISWNKLLQHRKNGVSLEHGLAADRTGQSCTDALLARGLFPIGDYKGYGLGLMVEILCSLLANMPFGKHISPMYPLSKEKRKLGHFLMVIDISKFVRISIFKKRIKEMMSELRLQKTAKGFNQVMVPNDPEKKNYSIRVKKGIPIVKKDLLRFQRIAQKLNISQQKYKAFL